MDYAHIFDKNGKVKGLFDLGIAKTPNTPEKTSTTSTESTVDTNSKLTNLYTRAMTILNP